MVAQSRCLAVLAYMPSGGSARSPSSWLRTDHIVLKGPGGRSVSVEYQDWWPPELAYPCLYVGKSTNIRNRFSLHIKRNCLGQLHRALDDNRKVKPCTTSCQLRHGIEHVFRTNPDPLTLTLTRSASHTGQISQKTRSQNGFTLKTCWLARGALGSTLIRSAELRAGSLRDKLSRDVVNSGRRPRPGRPIHDGTPGGIRCAISLSGNSGPSGTFYQSWRTDKTPNLRSARRGALN